MPVALEADFSAVSGINTERTPVKGILGLEEERNEMQESMVLFSFEELSFV